MDINNRMSDVGEMRDEEDLMLMKEMDRMLQYEKAIQKTVEWKSENEKKIARNEDDKKMRIKVAGEMRREWILKNTERGKVREMQAILKGIIAAGVDVSCVNFSMRDMRNEIVRVERLIKVKEMRSEWEMRVKLETERKEMREKRESVKKLRDCRQIVWECVHAGMSESEKQKRMSMMREKKKSGK